MIREWLGERALHECAPRGFRNGSVRWDGSPVIRVEMEHSCGEVAAVDVDTKTAQAARALDGDADGKVTRALRSIVCGRCVPHAVADRPLVRIRYEDGTEDAAELHLTQPPRVGKVTIE